MFAERSAAVKVAFLSFGFEEYSIRLASALIREAEVLLLLPDELQERRLSYLDRSVRFGPFVKPRLRQPLRQIRMIAALLQRIRQYDPDVIHLQQGHFWFNLALPLLRRYALVLTIHDPRYHVGDRESQKTPQAIMEFGFRRASQIIVHGRQLKQMVVDELHVPEEIVHVVPMIALGDDSAQTTCEEQEGLVLFFGRIWEYKGLEYLIRAEPLITAQLPEAKIVIAGQGEDFTRYRRMMRHPERFVVYNEYVSDEKGAELFQQASVVVLPYIDATQSAVIPVAYTFAKPVVATTVGSLPEMVEPGQTGYLVPPRDEQALADAIVRLLRDKALRQRMGANARNKVENEYSAGAVAHQTLSVYERAVRDRSAQTRRSDRKAGLPV